MPPTRDGQWRFFAQQFGGEINLTKWLKDQRAGHQSYEAIAYMVTSKTDEFVSAATVRRWCIARLADWAAAGDPFTPLEK